MSQATRRGAAVGGVALAVVAAVVAITAGALPGGDAPAQVEQKPPAASGPTFLAVADLPTSQTLGTSWTAQPGGAGLPDPEYTCVKGMIPSGKTTYRTWNSDMTGEARETITVLGTADEAKLIAKEVAQSIERCSKTVGQKTTWTSYGHVASVDGLELYGVFFAPKDSEYHLQMFGVGRDGKNVVVTSIGQMGRKAEAPLDAFTIMAKTALEKAF
jgi:hypothetical protein